MSRKSKPENSTSEESERQSKKLKLTDFFPVLNKSVDKEDHSAVDIESCGNIKSDDTEMCNNEKNSNICGKKPEMQATNFHQSSKPNASNIDDHDCEKIITVYDIGNHVGKPITDLIKKNLLLNHWSPPKNYVFPFSLHNKKGKEEKRYASHKYLNDYEWLVFSDVRQGFFCKFCSLFVNAGVGGYRQNIPLNKLVTQPLTSFAKLLGKDGALTKHVGCEYHSSAVKSGLQFLKVLDNPKLEVISQINQERLRQITENRLRLKPIIQSIIFLGRQNIPLRGHRDDGPFEIDSPVNQGNFRELLKFRIQSGDGQLKAYLENSSARATYISKTIQNEIIDCCGKEILFYIINRVKKAEYYSILFDETQDISRISQLTLVIRYLNDGVIREDFVKFVDLLKEVCLSNENERDNLEIKVKGFNFGQVVLKTLSKLGLDPNYCVGITTDGCSVMTSESCGAVATVKKEAKNAVYSPCHNHILNLALSKSSSIQSVRNSIGVMKETISFFRGSAKRSSTLKKIMGSELSGLCETRWIERHDGVIQFRYLLPDIIETLDAISSWTDIQTASRARSLKLSLCDSSFIVTVVCLSDILNCTLPLSRLFQKTQVDLKIAQNTLQDTLKLLNEKREKSIENFAALYEEICSIANELGVDIKIPRKTARQVHRENYPSQSPIDYYRQAIHIPIIENITEDIKQRFPEETLNLYSLSVLFPDSNILKNDKLSEEIAHVIAEKYHIFFKQNMNFIKTKIIGELSMWKVKWEREKYDPSLGAIHLLNSCDRELFPILHVLLRIFVTLPISAASGERTFSSLRRIKTWIRSTVTEERLNGLALLNIHSEIILNEDKIIDRFAESKRRIDLVL